MNQADCNKNRAIYYFRDPQFCQISWNTLSQLWPIIEKAPLRKGKEKHAGLLELPELIQLELALILIRRDYLSLRLGEEGPEFEIVLEVSNTREN